MRNRNQKIGRLSAFVVLAAVLSGCSTPDFLSKDAEWFSRPRRLFTRSISIDAPPLTPERPITSEDLVSAEGACPGMAPPPGPADANASGDAPPVPAPTGNNVALGHTECDVVRGIGAPDSVNIGNNGGDRVATVTWLRGPRAGIYTFTGGRLTSVEKGPDVEPPPKAVKPKAKKKKAAT